MKTAMLVKIARGQRVRSTSHAGYSMEFSDLLDRIDPEPIPVAAEVDISLADLVMFPVPHRFDQPPEPVAEQVAEPVALQVEEQVQEQIAAPPKVSRFADTGLDDDLLPVQAPRRRHRR